MKKVFIGIKVENTLPFESLIEKLMVMFQWEKMKWVSKENLHFTLLYFGKTSPENISLIQQNMIELLCDLEKFEISYKNSGVFKSIHNPRVLWVGIEKNNSINIIKKVIDKIAHNLNVPIDHTEYIPHVTVAQLKWADQNTTVERYVKEFSNTLFGSEKLQKISLFEVVEEKGNKYYNELFAIDLK